MIMDRLLDYDISEVIYEDAVTGVYRSQNRQTQETVILKTLRATPTARQLARLRHEYAVLMDLDDPGVARPIALIEQQRSLVLVQEDIGGVPLTTVIADGPCPLERFFPLALDLVSILEHIHRHQIIHRDLKPSNIIINRRTGQMQIIDFGLASRLSREHPQLTPPDLIEGTLPYLAPEQTGRMNRVVDYRADFYALGISFYQLLTGELPFVAHDALEWVHCHLARTPRPITAQLPSIPQVVSEIVDKLLAKLPEDRYQSAAGLHIDLLECQRQWKTKSAITPFALGAADVTDRLQIPQKLYGREKDVATLLASFGRVAAGGQAEGILVTGYAGIGKSALVAELHTPIVAQRGIFISGKFDQLDRGVPYAAITHAFQGLIQQILAESEDQISGWRQRLQVALGAEAQVLIELMPQLSLLIGSPPPLVELPPDLAQHRLHRMFQTFVAVFAQPDHPLVLFLDDLQWADTGSLTLLTQLLVGAEIRNLLFIGAYRDNEVQPGHPLLRMQTTLTERDHPLWTMALFPLSQSHITQLLTDTLGATSDEVAPLAALIDAKTHGNPFFCFQFITALHQDGLLVFDYEARRWRWDMTGIDQRGFTDNVVDLLLGEIRKLPLDTQRALQFASFLGNRFDLTTLGGVTGRTPQQLEDDLWPALLIEILRRDATHWRFMHDRMQEAAYTLTPEGERTARHLQIGRMLRDAVSQDEFDEQLFAITTHLNAGAALITDDHERVAVAELNLRAARKAQSALSHTAAAIYYARGFAILPTDHWEQQYELSFALAAGQARATFVIGELDRIEPLCDSILPHTRGVIDLATVQQIRIDRCALVGDLPRALTIASTCLHELGVDLPAQVTSEDILYEEEHLSELMAGRAITELTDLPLMTDPLMQKALDIALAIYPTLYLIDVPRYHFLGCKGTQISLLHGNTRASPMFYSGLGLLRGEKIGSYQDGYELGRVACDLIERNNWSAERARVWAVHAYMLQPFVEPVQAGIPMLVQTFDDAKAIGDFAYAAFSAFELVASRYFVGDSLREVTAELEARLPFVRSLQFELVLIILGSIQALVRNLRGQTLIFGSFLTADGEGAAFEAAANALPVPYSTAWYYTFKMQAGFFSGDYVATREAAAAAALTMPLVPAQIVVPIYHFFSALTLAASYVGDAADVVAIKIYLDYLATRAEANPSSFAHIRALVAAELARIEGRDREALAGYQQAIDLAQQNGFIHHEAIANECAARFYRERGVLPVAMLHLRSARQCYDQWGADGKVRQLEEQFPQLRVPGIQDHVTTSSTTTAQLDTLAVAKAAQAISSQIVRDQLLETLLTIVLEQAGAQRAELLLAEGDTLTLAASATVDQQQIYVHLHHSATDDAELPHTLLTYVRRSHERVLLHDARVAHPFSSDPHLVARQPHAVLALPILRQGELVGVLYLEHQTITHVFTINRLAVIEQLAAQAAISLENAQLYGQLAEHNRTLEERVAERTTQLADANSELEEANQELKAFAYSVSHDLRGPLRAINGYTAILAEDYHDQLDADGQEICDVIGNETRRMQQLIDDLLAFSRFSRAPIHAALVDMQALANDVFEELFRSMDHLHVEFQLAALPDAVGDPALLRQVWINLLSNAIKYSSKRPHAIIQVFGTRDNHQLIYHVQDNGAGFDMQYAEKLFGVFQRIHSDNEFPGTGVGLAIVERIIKRHGGAIWAASVVEQGATFTFSLPVRDN